jgi:hypothetical protein
MNIYVASICNKTARIYFKRTKLGKLQDIETDIVNFMPFSVTLDTERCSSSLWHISYLLKRLFMVSLLCKITSISIIIYILRRRHFARKLHIYGIYSKACINKPSVVLVFLFCRWCPMTMNKKQPRCPADSIWKRIDQI